MIVELIPLLLSTSRATPPASFGLGCGHQLGEVRPRLLAQLITVSVFLTDSRIVRSRNLVDKFFPLQATSAKL